MKRLISALMVGLLLAALSGTAALAGEDNNGQAIGKDPLRLALTQCSNAGIGNGGEYEVEGKLFIFKGSLLSDCLDKCLLKKYTREEKDAIMAQAGCEFIGWEGVAGAWVCEIDPGNSAQNNNAQGSNGDPQSEAAD